MFGWFKKQEETIQEFSDNAAAFAYACENQQNRLLQEAMIPALVEEEGRRGSDGERCFLIRAAGPDGGRGIWTCVLPGAPDCPDIGDLVGFRIVSLVEDAGHEPLPIGYIDCILAPVYVSRKGWRIAKILRPDNLKQTIRF